MREFRDLVADQADHLGELDAAIGDGDHGVNMDRGARAVAQALAVDSPGGDQTETNDQAEAEESLEELFRGIGMTLVGTIGGAAGPLYGTLFLRFASGLGDGRLDATSFADALARGLEGVRARGRAVAGDKTMLDALTPAVDALRQACDAGEDLANGLARAATAAKAGCQATAPMLARKGRASYLGERSIGHIDPGAASMALLVEAAARAAAA
jgi:dihydroxyacetone kinase-like protein